MDDKMIDTIADVMWEALDWDGGMPHSGVNASLVAEEFLTRLRGRGVVVVELPSGEVNPDVWANQAGGVTFQHHKDLVSNFTVHRAHELAAALLAAVEAAKAVA